MSDRRHARVAAPAKVNLGLEILGRRPDGYHEIGTVLAMLELADELDITLAQSAGTTVTGVPGIAPEDNLIVRAATRFAGATGIDAGHEIAVTKRIPSPAGMGGASSDAAATLLALNALHGEPLDGVALGQVAASLGSDVPFFLGSPIALATGRGTELAPLPNIDGHLLIAVPLIGLTAKTAALYGMLTPGDFTAGARIERIVEGITRRRRVDPALLGNAFERPLAALAPDAVAIVNAMREAGCARGALSGAGPAHYALIADEQSAQEAAARLRGIVQRDVAVFVTRFRQEPVRVALG